jgi:hypothetical protein
VEKKCAINLNILRSILDNDHVREYPSSWEIHPKVLRVVAYLTHSQLVQEKNPNKTEKEKIVKKVGEAGHWWLACNPS